MKKLASASIECAVTEENKEIIKRALSTELDVNVSQWNENELEFKLDAYRILVTIDVLLDSKGYSIVSCGDIWITYGHALIYGLIGIPSFFMLFVFFSATTDHKMSIGLGLWIAFSCTIILVSIGLKLLHLKAKIKTWKALKKVSRMIQR